MSNRQPDSPIPNEPGVASPATFNTASQPGGAQSGPEPKPVDGTRARFVGIRDVLSPLGAFRPQGLRSTVLVNLALTAVGLVSSGLVPFGFNFTVGRHYGPIMLGHAAVALSLGLLLGQIPGTIGSGATKFIAEALGAGDEEKADRVLRALLFATVVAGLFLGGAVLALFPWLQNWLHLDFAMVALSAGLIPTYALYLYFKSCYYGYSLVRTYLFNEVLSDAAFFAVLLCIFLLGATPLLLLPFVVNNAAFAAIALADLWPNLIRATGLTKSERSRVLGYCLVNGSGSVASLSRWSLGTVIAGWYLSAHSVGLFAAAVAITAPLALLPRAISLVTFALMARLHGAGDQGAVSRVLQQATEWLVFLLGIPSGLAIINSGPLLSGVFGARFSPATTATQFIILGAYITDISRPSIDALSSTIHVRIATFASFIGLAVSVLLWLTLIPRYGITSAGVGFAVGAAFTALIPAWAAIRYLQSNPSVFVRPAIMLCGLGALDLLLPHELLLDSVLFTAAMCAVYLHLVRDIWGLITAIREAPNTVLSSP